MTWTGLVRIGVLGLAVFAASLGACQAGDRMRAVPGKPAVLTAGPATAAMLGGADLGAAHALVLEVSAFTPPTDGKPAAIVVTATPAHGAPREIGRVAITPYAAFTAADTTKHQRFLLDLPADLAKEKTLTISVALAPSGGSGAGASLEVGSAAIR